MLKIYLDRLVDGQIETIQETISPELLEVFENDLSFPKNISIQGEAYVEGKELILQLSAKTSARLPCSVCNQSEEIAIHVKKFYHVEPCKANEPIFDYGSLIREAILLEVPLFIECNKGKCPERKNIEPYLKKEKHNFPFKGLTE